MKKIDVCWTRQDFVDLDYKSLGGYGTANFINFTHDVYKKSINNDVYSMPNPMPKFVDSVLKNFKYKIKAVAFNRTPPGNFLPLHCDLYTKFIEKFHIADPNQIHRFIIFLEHSKPGHLMQIENTVIADWSAGDYVDWSGSTKHAAYNLGWDHRYTLQITCFDKI